MAFKFREAKENEMQEMLQLIDDIFPNANARIKNDDKVIVAESSGSQIGFIHLREGKSRILLQGIGVLPAFRNRGVGSALLGEALKLCERKGKAVYLKVKAQNIPALSLYEKHGFFAKRDGSVLILEKKKEN